MLAAIHESYIMSLTEYQSKVYTRLKIYLQNKMVP